MSETATHAPSRRQFLKHTGRAAAATTLADMAVPHVHAAENNTLQVVLIGCGGRGTGAARDAMSVRQGPVKLVAMADVFVDRVRSRGHNFDDSKRIWRSDIPSGEGNPYQNEWNALVDAIRDDQPFNEVEHGVMASVVSSLGRMAAHTAREMTLDAMLNSPHEYAPGLDQWTMDSPAPIKADDDGNYPVPMPGIVTDREY